MIFCDAHLHIVECDSFPSDFICCSCAHSKDEFIKQEQISLASNKRIFSAFGIHPQNPLLENFDYLEFLLKQKKIIAIGETGFDFWSQEFKNHANEQKKAFEYSVELATQYKVPLIIHNRKALDLIFAYSSILKKVNSVVFHSFAFAPRDAFSILNHGINAYFSFGKPILNGKKNSIACIKELPCERLLLETDAPYQTLKGEQKTNPSQLKDVYNFATMLRCMEIETFASKIYENFFTAFCKK